jgi:hypothetical protein
MPKYNFTPINNPTFYIVRGYKFLNQKHTKTCPKNRAKKKATKRREKKKTVAL